ncbi:phosphotransferase [Streptomyces sp. IBSBF 2806]|uniref:phosphotransferase n=1 Tax=Streptomyces sp. IBSBF 2806 TaxID=2903529 RepID=UPI002FDBF97C
MTLTGSPVTTYGTGLLSTQIYPAVDSGYLWRRQPGPLAPDGFVLPSLDLADRATVSANDHRLVTAPAEPDGARIYRVAGKDSLAAHLLRFGPGPEAAHALHAVGALLARLHAVPADATVPSGPPRGWLRLRKWLAEEHGPTAAPAGELLRSQLGEQRWRTLQTWCDEALSDRQHTVICHGAPSLGGVVFTLTGPIEVLTGEDLCLAPWSTDLGWLIGELIELSWTCGGDPQAWQALLASLYSGYGKDLGQRWNRAAALRITLHLHDFSTYVAWRPNEVRRYAGFLRFLIDL